MHLFLFKKVQVLVHVLIPTPSFSLFFFFTFFEFGSRVDTNTCCFCGVLFSIRVSIWVSFLPYVFCSYWIRVSGWKRNQEPFKFLFLFMIRSRGPTSFSCLCSLQDRVLECDLNFAPCESSGYFPCPHPSFHFVLSGSDFGLGLNFELFKVLIPSRVPIPVPVLFRLFVGTGSRAFDWILHLVRVWSPSMSQPRIPLTFFPAPGIYESAQIQRPDQPAINAITARMHEQVFKLHCSSFFVHSAFKSLEMRTRMTKS